MSQVFPCARTLPHLHQYQLVDLRINVIPPPTPTLLVLVTLTSLIAFRLWLVLRRVLEHVSTVTLIGILNTKILES